MFRALWKSINDHNYFVMQPLNCNSYKFNAILNGSFLSGKEKTYKDSISKIIYNILLTTLP